jgi:hypothetical protein
MDLVPAVLCLLVIHAALGAFDTFVFHEWREHLPAQRWAARELLLHCLRSLLFTAIFLGLAWFEWHGVFGWLVVAVVGVEYIVTIADAVAEDRTRALSRPERINHMLLALNSGLYTALLAWHVATRWSHEASAVVAGHHPPWLAGALTFAAAGTALWAVRDGLASRRLRPDGALASRITAPPTARPRPR